MKILLTLTLSTFLIFSSPSWGADFHKGLAAAQSGDFETALREWVPLAEQGDARAQYNLGVNYVKGEGVIQDSVYAHMWFNIAASNGLDMGTEARGLIAKNMTPSQVEKAQDLARKCVAKNYKDC